MNPQITPMDEGDLRIHFGRQSSKKLKLVDLLHLSESDEALSNRFDRYIDDGNEIVMFDTLDDPYSVFMGDDEYTARFEDVPTIACVDGETDYYAGVDREAWSKSVTIEQYNVMQREVAKKVKEGKREDALGELRRFRSEVAWYVMITSTSRR